MEIERSVDINRPIEDVFRLTIEHVADWSDVVVESTMTRETPEVVGSTFRSVTAEHGREMQFEGEILSHEPPNYHAIFMRGEAFDLDVQYTFKASGSEQTRVTQRSQVNAKGIFRPIFYLIGRMMRKSSCEALDRELSNLKRFCESAARPSSRIASL